MKNKNIEGIFQECLVICDNKNADYATKADFYANFRSVETVGLPMWVGVFIRFQDKYSRLTGFIRRFNQTGKISSAVNESIEDTLKDGINYLAICLDSYREWTRDLTKANYEHITDNNDVDFRALKRDNELLRLEHIKKGIQS